VETGKGIFERVCSTQNSACFSERWKEREERKQGGTFENEGGDWGIKLSLGEFTGAKGVKFPLNREKKAEEGLNK